MRIRFRHADGNASIGWAAMPRYGKFESPRRSCINVAMCCSAEPTRWLDARTPQLALRATRITITARICRRAKVERMPLYDASISAGDPNSDIVLAKEIWDESPFEIWTG
jgi:hypothetical protein